MQEFIDNKLVVKVTNFETDTEIKTTFKDLVEEPALEAVFAVRDAVASLAKDPVTEVESICRHIYV
ncbi:MULTISPECIES: DUF1659 domain-containing protein [Aerococcus]|uniref:DUF1659 domain-containing protein n=1 Tax=Aerococcus mictus TaxID=2976810 RepID=A0ABZ2ECG4_9LACT|nr:MULTISPECIES: hypothetical protein [Aerococcus]AEA00277.1 hypothetical protein HMPREF9243_0210 [Aerococcus sp. Group 1]KAA9290049.1 hypothetical protein F6I06_09015 [Aerococcus mictus]MBU5610885.1 hypothetical protein [Aerococcus urinae]MCY3055019.1 hypothetical protein [Aerococcus sp. Group 1]MCY3056781.1 hypothetical protein [Aerococcus sp. Group 1]